MLSEEWRPIPGFEGLYEASDQGRIRSLDRSFINRAGQPLSVRGRILSSRADYGYPSVTLCDKGIEVRRNVHRLVLMAFTEPPSADTPVVRHVNGDPSDNRLVNLQWGTQRENAIDTVVMGRHANAAKTHCKHGHEFTPENTRLRPDWGRSCKRCEYEKNKKRRLANAAAKRKVQA